MRKEDRDHAVDIIAELERLAQLFDRYDMRQRAESIRAVKEAVDGSPEPAVNDDTLAS